LDIRSNRTIVGLKLTAATAAGQVIEVQQSHHCGIETAAATHRVVIFLTQQSHHCGIETHAPELPFLLLCLAAIAPLWD